MTTTAPQPGLTLEQYAEAKKLPLEFLKEFGLSGMTYDRAPAVRIPYLSTDREEVSIRFRLALDGESRFRWRSGSKAIPYGLWRLDGAREEGELTLVEGESDCHTLWHHGVPALGLPGATTWRDEYAEHLDGFEKVYAVVEPDQGGETLVKKLAGSPIRDRVFLLRLDGFKDVSEAHLAGRLREVWEEALGAAEPLRDHLDQERKQRQQEAWTRCAELAESPRILDRFEADLKRAGVVGEERTAKLLYLVLTSRLLDKPVSAVVKGPSSAGKSFLTEQVIRFFPESATYALSAMSERALAYSQEPLKHRHLVVYEAAGLQGDFASYLVRSLLSEGRLRYETVEKGPEGMRPRLIEREGPTGLIVTTTRIKLHPENETRLLSLPVTDSREQTKAVLRALAAEVGSAASGLSEWCSLQEWLALARNLVTVPFAEDLADLTRPVGVRLRRDFGALLSLIRAHAILHQVSRERDSHGRIVATLEDYSETRELVVDLVSEGVEVAVPETVRETEQAVRRLAADSDHGIPVSALAAALKLDRSAAYRRARQAEKGGFLKNLADKGRPLRLVLGDEPLPENQEIFPTVEALRARCTVARQTEGIGTPPSPPAVAENEKAETVRVVV